MTIARLGGNSGNYEVIAGQFDRLKPFFKGSYARSLNALSIEILGQSFALIEIDIASER